MTPVEGFLTFISVDKDGKKFPHGLTLDEAQGNEEAAVREKAMLLK